MRGVERGNGESVSDVTGGLKPSVVLVDDSKEVRTLVRRLLELRALVEATLDFPEEDIDAEDRLQSQARLGHLREQLRRALEQARQWNFDEADIYSAMASCYLKTNKKAEARQMVRECLQRNPNNVEANRLQKQL